MSEIHQVVPSTQREKVLQELQSLVKSNAARAQYSLIGLISVFFVSLFFFFYANKLAVGEQGNDTQFALDLLLEQSVDSRLAISHVSNTLNEWQAAKEEYKEQFDLYSKNVVPIKMFDNNEPSSSSYEPRDAIAKLDLVKLGLLERDKRKIMGGKVNLQHIREKDRRGIYKIFPASSLFENYKVEVKKLKKLIGEEQFLTVMDLLEKNGLSESAWVPLGNVSPLIFEFKIVQAIPVLDVDSYEFYVAFSYGLDYSFVPINAPKSFDVKKEIPDLPTKFEITAINTFEDLNRLKINLVENKDALDNTRKQLSTKMADELAGSSTSKDIQEVIATTITRVGAVMLALYLLQILLSLYRYFVKLSNYYAGKVVAVKSLVESEESELKAIAQNLNPEIIVFGKEPDMPYDKLVELLRFAKP